MKKALIALAASASLIPATASAADILYRVDYNVGTDIMQSALNMTTHSVTFTSGDLSGFDLSSFDLVIYANQDTGSPAGDIGSLNSFITGGGSVIYTNWLDEGIDGDADYTGNVNLTELSLGMELGAGIASPLAVVNTGWGIYSNGLSAQGGVVAATFENGDAAIVIGNGGRTIVNGFLTDTVASEQLYLNEINYLLGGAAVPEASTWAMMILGLGLAGAALRRRDTSVTVTYA